MREPLATMLNIMTMKKVLFVIIILILNHHFAILQNIQYVEFMPIFNGEGNVYDFKEYIICNMEYPSPDSLTDLEGSQKMVVSFIVDTIGQVTDINIVKGFHEEYNKAVIKVMSESPSWMPGKNRDKPVNVILHLSLEFEFSD